jgi:hypothetical protein
MFEQPITRLPGCSHPTIAFAGEIRELWRMRGATDDLCGLAIETALLAQGWRRVSRLPGLGSEETQCETLSDRNVHSGRVRLRDCREGVLRAPSGRRVPAPIREEPCCDG